jgi:hypothetical protein
MGTLGANRIFLSPPGTKDVFATWVSWAEFAWTPVLAVPVALL